MGDVGLGLGLKKKGFQKLGGLNVPHPSFQPFHAAVSEGSHVTVRISSKVDIRNV